ncbi:hypothetical protein HYPSUDRAFT_64622 [Hypholoma sublateritium FD-334 SS-4]|uniref:Armadillo-like helical domain-containing protein n=1 Tax=Hypholoma sublateritium (strain FD-334 SS-4) TaxID=945553 RepID=A0A0D2P4Q1_HYPSF|nr:hypothetical protein HYPSUDRAFT_64622 [Hypholoma sublateritium FD-334 SS-4]
MEIFAGSVAQSDFVFSQFTEIIETVMGDENAPASIKHRVLQLALSFICGVEQLSTGAYFLRRNFFPSIVSFVKNPSTEQYAFEAVMLLSILANYHKTDAAKLNPYLKLIRESSDGDFMRKICWASNFTLGTSIKAYQVISDDSPSTTLASSFESMLNRFRPNRAFSLSASSPSDKFKDQPIESSVVLLSLFEFLYSNPLFANVFMEDLISPTENASSSTPLFCTVISFTSYLCAHASSVDSARSIAYAKLSLNLLLVLVENNVVMEYTTQIDTPVIRLCRQRTPVSPLPVRATQPPICSVIDCCVIWLRHNLQKRLEVSSFNNCVWICYRIVWFLQSRRLRLNYDWTELWISTIGLLSFLASKTDSLHTTGGVELLASETIRFLDLALCSAEAYLPSPRAMHELIYELVRSSSVLKKQQQLLKSLELPHVPSSRSLFGNDPIEDTLSHIILVADFYADKVGKAGVNGNASDVMKIIAAEIEANGVHGTRELSETMPITHSQDVLDFGRHGCADVRALLP